ncbi:MAG TPA: acyloxyacyl hydrolase [Bacteroidota bacterium]|nr:acyloxyacyl hydrolase [Bacteroidota bacterium]
MRSYFRAALLLIAGLLPGAMSMSDAQTIARDDSAQLVQFSAGMYDVRRQSATVEYQAEIYPAYTLGIFRTKASISATRTDDIFAGGGVALPIDLSSRVFLMPSFNAGLYKHGKGIELGYFVEFRSYLEIAWQCTRNSCIGISIYHVSNGSLSNTNPGLESLLTTYFVQL